jgi:AraC-like DNA-binding protein
MLATDFSSVNRFRAEEIFSQAEHGIARCNGGGDFFVLGIIFRFQGHLPSILLNRLPAVIEVDGSSDHASVLRGSLDRFCAEMRTGGVGRSLILSHLAPIMLLQTLRFYLASAPKEANWLVALTHPRLGKVLEAMQTDYKRDWSLAQLAKIANMSRSGFALTFQKKVGVSPMVYLTNWRMQIACELLGIGDQNLASIANDVGYGSESAFSTAFTRIVKCRPGNYRRPAVRS